MCKSGVRLKKFPDPPKAATFLPAHAKTVKPLKQMDSGAYRVCFTPTPSRLAREFTGPDLAGHQPQGLPLEGVVYTGPPVDGFGLELRPRTSRTGPALDVQHGSGIGKPRICSVCENVPIAACELFAYNVCDGHAFACQCGLTCCPTCIGPHQWVCDEVAVTVALRRKFL